MKKKSVGKVSQIVNDSGTTRKGCYFLWRPMWASAEGLLTASHKRGCPHITHNKRTLLTVKVVSEQALSNLTWITVMMEGLESLLCGPNGPTTWCKWHKRLGVDCTTFPLSGSR